MKQTCSLMTLRESTTEYFFMSLLNREIRNCHEEFNVEFLLQRRITMSL